MNQESFVIKKLCDEVHSLMEALRHSQERCRYLQSKVDELMREEYNAAQEND